MRLLKTCQAWQGMTTRLLQCQKCFDTSFVTPLLQSPLPQDRVQQILVDIAEVTPLSSDSVEVKNGNIQLAAGCRCPHDIQSQKSGKENGLLMSIRKHWNPCREAVEEVTLPSKRTSSHIRQQVGTTSIGKYTKAEDFLIEFVTSFAHAAVFPVLIFELVLMSCMISWLQSNKSKPALKKETTRLCFLFFLSFRPQIKDRSHRSAMMKVDAMPSAAERLDKKAETPTRELSGWNIFHRERLQELASNVDPGHWAFSP